MNSKIANLLKDIVTDTPPEHFDISNINIAVTELATRKMIIHNKFLSLAELSRCATASSFIPFVTQNNAISFYKHKLIFDGGFLKKRYIKNVDTRKTLIISFTMFKRFKSYPLFSFIKPKRTIYTWISRCTKKSGISRKIFNTFIILFLPSNFILPHTLLQ